MKAKPWLFVLGGIIILTFGGHRLVSVKATKVIEEQLPAFIKIRQLGIVPSGVVLRNISMHDPLNTEKKSLQVQKVSIKLNWIELAVKQDLRAINSILIERGIFRLHHYEDDTFDIGNYIQYFTSGDQKATTLDIGKIIIQLKDATVEYYDERGFGKEPLANPKLHVLRQAQAEFSVNENGLDINNLVGKLNNEETNIKIKGKVDFINNAYELDLHADNAEIAELINYFNPSREVNVLKARGVVDFSLRPVESNSKEDLPLSFSVTLDVKESEVKLLWLSSTLNMKQGLLRVDNHQVLFRDVQGDIVGQKLDLNGTVGFNGEINLEINSAKIEMAKVDKILAILSPLGFQGSARSNIKIDTFGRAKDLRIFGKVLGFNGKALGFDLQQTAMSFTLVKDDFVFNLDKINAYGGSGKGRGSIKVGKGEIPSTISLDLQLTKFVPEKYFGAKGLSGDVDVEVKIDSLLSEVEGNLIIEAEDFYVFGQQLLNGNIIWKKTQDKLLFLEGTKLSINQATANFDLRGYLNSTKDFEYEFRANPFKLEDMYFFFNKKKEYQVLGEIEQGKLSGRINDSFKKDPLAVLKGEVFYRINSFKLDTLTKDYKGFANLKFDKGLYVVGEINNDNSWGKLSLLAQQKGLELMDVSANNIDLEIIKYFIKPIGFEYRGLFSGELRLFKNNNNLFVKGFGAKGRVDIKKAEILRSNIDEFQGEIVLQENLLLVKNGKFKNGYSYLVADVDFVSTKNFSVKLLETSKFSHEGWGMLPAEIRIKLPRLNGNFGIKDELMQADVQMQTDELVYKNVKLPLPAGQIRAKDNLIFFEQVVLNYFGDSYKVNGFLNKNEIFKKKGYKFDIEVLAGSVEKLFGFYADVQKNWMNKQEDKEVVSEVKSDVFSSYSALNSKQIKTIFNVGDEDVLSLLESLKKLEKEEVLVGEVGMSGKIFGRVHFSNQDFLRFNSNLKLQDLEAKAFEAKEMTIFSRLTGDIVNIEIVADKTRVMNKEAENIYLKADYFVTNQNLRIKELIVNFFGHKTNNILHGDIGLKGFFEGDLGKNSLDLEVNLKGNDIDIVSFLHKMFKQITNQGELVLKVVGSLKKPVIQSLKLDICDLKISFIPEFVVKGEFLITTADIKIMDSRFLIDKSVIFWQGEDTDNKINRISLWGEVAWLGFSDNFGQTSVWFDLAMQPTELNLNIKDMYSGKAKLEDTTLVGTMDIALRRKNILEFEESVLYNREVGPILKSKTNIFDGTYFVNIGFAKNVGKFLKPPILLDVVARLGKMQVSQAGQGSEFEKWFSNLFFIIEEQQDSFPIKGSLNTIELERKFKLSDGRMVFMNKIFHLMDRRKQREIFRSGTELIKDNIAEIKMTDDPDPLKKRASSAVFDIRLYSEVDEVVITSDSLVSTTNMKSSVEKHLFVIFVEGPITSIESFSIEHYKKIETGYELITQKIKFRDMSSEQYNTVISYLAPALLNPQFYESVINKGLKDNEEANEIVRQYSASQINYWIDRQLDPIESELAKNIGLYEVNIEHNLGGDIVNTLPVFQRRYVIAEEGLSDVQVEFVKDLFFKKVFVKVKTGVSQEPTKPLLSMSQYELMWFLNDYLSLNYGNYNLNNPDNMYGAFSINANFDF